MPRRPNQSGMAVPGGAVSRHTVPKGSVPKGAVPRGAVSRGAVSEDALSEVIGFILIIALIMIFLSLWMVYVVPADGRQQEIEHMNYVRNWFTQYKITADSLWVNHDDDKSLTGMTFSNSLVLGSQGGATQAGGFFMPLMRPIGSTGGVAITNYPALGGSERIEVVVQGHDPIDPVTLGRVEYSATNNYWTDQSYYFQMGGIFLRQPTGTVARVAPLINFEESGSVVSAHIIILQVAGTGQTGISGQGPVRVDTKLMNVTEPQTLKGSSANITIYLNDDSAARGWANILKELRFQSGVSEDNCLIYRDPGNVVRIDLSGTDVHVTYRYVYNTISVQSIASPVS